MHALLANYALTNFFSVFFNIFLSSSKNPEKSSAEHCNCWNNSFMFIVHANENMLVNSTLQKSGSKIFVLIKQVILINGNRKLDFFLCLL